MRKLSVIVSAVAMLAAATSADAALLQFTITGTDSLSGIDPAPIVFASFRIDSDPVVLPENVAPGQGFALADVAGVFQYGTTIRTTPQPINFYNASQNGGLIIGRDLFLAFDGPQLYTGMEATPTFRTGSFILTKLTTASPISLTIAEVPAIPEPASWALMLTGFAMVGGATRYRRRGMSIVHA